MKRRIRFNEVLEAEEEKELEENKVLESEQDANKGKGTDTDVKQEEIKRPSGETFVSKDVAKAMEVKTENFDVKQKETEPHETNKTEESKEVKEEETLAEVNTSIPVSVELKIDTPESIEPTEEPAEEPVTDPTEIPQEPESEITDVEEANLCKDCPECLPLTKDIIESCKITEDLDLSEAMSTSKTITVNINGKTYAYEAESVADAKDVVYRFNKLRKYSKGRALSWLKKQVDFIGTAEEPAQPATEEEIPANITPELEPETEAVDAALFDVQQACQEKGIRIESKKAVNGDNILSIENIDADKLAKVAQILLDNSQQIINADITIKPTPVTDAENIKEDETEEPEEVPTDVPAEETEPTDAPTEEPADSKEAQDDKDIIEVVIDAIINQDADKIEDIQSLIERIKAIDENVSLYRLESEERDPKVVLAKVENGTTDIAGLNQDGEVEFTEIPTQIADIENVTPEILHTFLNDKEEDESSDEETETPSEEVPTEEPETDPTDAE